MRGKAPNIIPKDQFNARLKAIMPDLIKKGKAENQDQLKELFTLHNDVVYPPQTKMSCCGCRARVFRYLKGIYETLQTN